MRIAIAEQLQRVEREVAVASESPVSVERSTQTEAEQTEAALTVRVEGLDQTEAASAVNSQIVSLELPYGNSQKFFSKSVFV